MRAVASFCVICLSVLGSVPAHAQRLDTTGSVPSSAPRPNAIAVSVWTNVSGAVGFGLSRTSGVAARLASGSHSALPHGVVGVTLGALVGGAIGYVRVQMYYDGADPCDATRSTAAGAAIGAGLGALLEYVIRNHHYSTCAELWKAQTSRP